MYKMFNFNILLHKINYGLAFNCGLVFIINIYKVIWKTGLEKHKTDVVNGQTIK